MKIVVGKAGHNTVIFTDSLEYIVFSPYWNVPESIVKNEILPEMKTDEYYLENNNMEQTGTRNGLPVIRQLPGGDNALGRVKFIFPNNFNIYFHDTPAKSLFEQDDRAFSHGCIRLSEPERLAEYLLRNDDYWTDSRIFDAMYSGENKWVKLKHKVPVYIVYFTAWVSQDGILNFRDDIYGHDKKMKEMMFTEN
jgi:murein L,D-transpeptidase YcbB/YkuD